MASQEAANVFYSRPGPLNLNGAQASLRIFAKGVADIGCIDQGAMHLIRWTMASIVVAGALLGSSACSKRVSDDTIVAGIQDKVAADPVTKDSKVKVAAKNGRVTLTGTTKTRLCSRPHRGDQSTGSGCEGGIC